MVGATPYIQKQFNMNEKLAKAYLVEWMDTFKDRHETK